MLSFRSILAIFPLITVGTLLEILPAQAVIFDAGDTINLNVNVEFADPNDPGDRFFRFDTIDPANPLAGFQGIFAPINTYGDFTFASGTGTFGPGSGLLLFDESYDIQSFSAASPPVGPFVRFDLPNDANTPSAGGGNVKFTLNPSTLVINVSDIGNGLFEASVSGSGIFTNGNTALGSAGFTGQFVQGQTVTSGSVTLVVDEPIEGMPEPSTIFGLLSVGALAASGLKKRQQH
ncbi:PEP-CTERM sorting domain-containing protein [Chroococcus sp. FPU101]|uniref:PEP-CTERM sorting domain-containing protein n=1 Tax=Chroococcus sp. FPU101 TaxID=1974212 RepID=UPI001A8EB3EB|nr:PEP-CTERM sorting domain-containing protein [Chroococcus sp. FPU101]GFE69553.1 hypothetical protein CFPU101_21630 [Chroococcus sp. FPU101]